MQLAKQRGEYRSKMRLESQLAGIEPDFQSDALTARPQLLINESKRNEQKIDHICLIDKY